MEEIFKIAQVITPTGIIFLLIVVILNIINGKGIGAVFGKGGEGKKNPNPNDEPISMDILNRKLDVIAGNHLHGLPDMAKTLDRLEVTSGQIKDLLIEIRADLRK